MCKKAAVAGRVIGGEPLNGGSQSLSGIAGDGLGPEGPRCRHVVYGEGVIGLGLAADVVDLQRAPRPFTYAPRARPRRRRQAHGHRHARPRASRRPASRAADVAAWRRRGRAGRRPRRPLRPDPLRPRPPRDRRAVREQRTPTCRCSPTTTRAPTPQGNRTIEYTMIWSNEDGGTNTPALMARWGRTTDIEWIYRVTRGRAGQARRRRLPGAQPRDAGVRRARARTTTRCCRSRPRNNNMLRSTDPAPSSRLPLLPRHRRHAPAEPRPRGRHGREPVVLPGDGQGDGARGQDRARRPTPPRRRCPTSATTSSPRSRRRPTPHRPTPGWRSRPRWRRRDLVRVPPQLAEQVDPARRPGRDHDRAPARHDRGRHRGDQGDRRARGRRPPPADSDRRHRDQPRIPARHRSTARPPALRRDRRRGAPARAAAAKLWRAP